MMKMNFTLMGLQRRMLLALVFCCSIQIGFAQPANDNCAGAIDLTPLITGNIETLPFAADGTTDSGVPQVCSSPGNDNYFSWTATERGLSFTSEFPGNPGIAVFASCADVAAGNDIDCLGTFANGDLSGWAIGDDLIIQIYDFAGSNANVSFSLSTLNIPDFCDFAQPLTLDGPDDYEICEGEETDLEVEVMGGGSAPDIAVYAYDGAAGPDDFATFNLLDANTATAVSNPTNFISGLAYNADGSVLYGHDGDASTLFTIDPATGVQTVIGTNDIEGGPTGSRFLTDIAFNNADGMLYALAFDANPVFTTSLYTISLTDGSASLVGTNATASFFFAIDDAGIGYGGDVIDNNLYSINLGTGAATVVGPIGFDIAFSQGADYNVETGLIIAAINDASAGINKEIIVIDPATGLGTSIGYDYNGGLLAYAALAQTSSTNNLTYSWSPATGLSCTTCPSPTANPTTNTTYTVVVEDACGQSATFSTDVNVNFPTGTGNGGDIVCINNINASVDADCSLTITADELVSGNLACPGLFGVDIAGTGLSTIQVGGSSQFQIGDVLEVEVTYPDGSNACWGFVTLEDKTAPTITCEDVTVSCNANTAIGTVNGVPGLGQPTVDESCGGVTLTSTDAVINGDCVDGFLRQIFRTFTATNASGMSVSCTQIITVERQTIADVTAPRNYDGFDLPTISCDNTGLSNPDSSDVNGSPLPLWTGFPLVNGEPASEACGLTLTYEDEIVADVCEGTSKIFRTFTILDHCQPSAGGGNRLDITQFIKIEDSTGPTVVCPGEITVSTDFDACVANIIIPVPVLTDICAPDDLLSYTAVLATPNGQLVALPSGGFVAQNLPVGKATIIYTAQDPCGNQTTCTTDIFVEDQVAPAMSCETFRQVSLQNINPNEPTLIFASAFDDGSFDACGIVSFEVRRMTGCIDFDWTTAGPGIDSDANGFINFRDRGTSAFYPAVPFSCCDIGNTVMVELRATDAAGNTNSCMVEVEVEDKSNPIVSCPPNVVIECLDPVPGYDFLSPVQTAAFNTEVFAGTPFNPGDFLGFYDGVVDNCGATLYIREGGSLDCGTGTLTRRFQAQDVNGNLSTPCTQRIRVINSDPFEIVDTECRTFPRTQNDTDLDPVGPHSMRDDVEWPCDLELECGIDPTPDNLEAMLPDCPSEFTGRNCKLDARPQIQRNDECDIIAMTFEDLELPIVGNTECRKILRKWIITDHCQFEIDNSTGQITAGYWEYTQLIKIIDNTAPVLECSPVAATVDADAATCDAEVALTINSNSNDCAGETLRFTYAIDFFNNGTIDTTGVGNDATDVYPIGEHRIIWSVEDFCGNVGDDCVQLFYVIDNTPPNIVALTQTDVNLANGEGVLWSVELEVSSFDICSDTIQSLIQKPSLGDGQSTPPASAAVSARFTCADLPAGGSDAVIPVDYWLQDGAGNWSYVTVIVNVDDSQNFCSGPPTTATVAGTIMTEELEAVGGVTVNIDGNASSMPEAMITDNDGTYSYNLATMMNYAIEPVRDDAPTIGLTAYDLILLGQHLLETATLDSPYKLIAADVNRSGSITSLDLIALRRVLLYIDDQFPNNTSWRFVETAYEFPNTGNPFVTTFPEVININNLTADQSDADFVAIKVGDLNVSAETSGLTAGDTRSKDGELIFNVADQKLVAGKTYSVDVKANDFTNMLGYQFTVAFDQNAVEFEDFTAGALRGLTADNFGFAKLNEGALTTVWTNTNAVSVNNDEVLFTLNFVAKKDGNLSDVISVDEVRFTPAEAYSNDGDLLDVAFNFDSKVSEAGFSLAQNRPNPFRNETVIEFELPEATTATLTIYDVAGRVLRVIEKEYTKGANAETINSSDLNATGVLYYQLDTPTQSATKKMIVIK